MYCYYRSYSCDSTSRSINRWIVICGLLVRWTEPWILDPFGVSHVALPMVKHNWYVIEFDAPNLLIFVNLTGLDMVGDKWGTVSHTLSNITVTALYSLKKSHYIVNMLVWCDPALFCFWYNALNLCTSPFHHVNLSNMKRFSISSSKSIEYEVCPATAPSASLAAILRSKGNSTPAFLSHSLLTFSSLQSHTTGSDPRP